MCCGSSNCAQLLFCCLNTLQLARSEPCESILIRYNLLREALVSDDEKGLTSICALISFAIATFSSFNFLSWSISFFRSSVFSLAEAVTVEDFLNLNVSCTVGGEAPSASVGDCKNSARAISSVEPY